MQLCTCCKIHPVQYQCPIDTKVGVCSACACMLSNKYDWTWNRVDDQDMVGLDRGWKPDSPTSAIGALSDSVTTVGQNIQTVAIVGLCIGALLFMYFIHEGHKTANRAFDFASAHPETVAKLAAI
jgi:hypothetical protein